MVSWVFDAVDWEITCIQQIVFFVTVQFVLVYFLLTDPLQCLHCLQPLLSKCNRLVFDNIRSSWPVGRYWAACPAVPWTNWSPYFHRTAKSLRCCSLESTGSSNPGWAPLSVPGLKKISIQDLNSSLFVSDFRHRARKSLTKQFLGLKNKTIFRTART